MNNISILGNDCCGCTACEQICPKKCITFKENNEGFMYPVVDESVCVNCGACVKHCPVMTPPHSDGVQNVYASKYCDTQKAKESTSGGIFIPLAKSTLEKGGVVFGCAYDENLVARHIAVEKEADLHKLQGSKYVQSDLSGIYSHVKSELKSGRNVLFSGTGCQVAGLRSFLGKDFDNLITVDITLADFWGIEYINPPFYSENGVSLVLVNTDKGKRLWKSLENCIESVDSTVEQAVQMNKNLSSPSHRPECRDTIYDGFDGDFDSYVMQKLYVKPSLKRKLKSLVPVSLKGRIKHMLKK